ncbi:MAG: hypothetical protein HKN29_07830 [Rhodothermales bacterium]|nr:hypothetical protein [Rhodothermales bacterium]
MTLDLESRNPEQMAAFFLGAYGDADEVEAALSGSSIHLDSLSLFAPELAGRLAEAAQGGTVTREAFSEAITATYRRAAGIPSDVAGMWSLVKGAGERPGDSGAGLDPPDASDVADGGALLDSRWLTYEVTGSMTEYRRRIHVQRDDLRSALGEYLESGALRYPAGTVIVGEHLEDGRTVETTFMQRRRDGFWTFGAYDATGAATDSIAGSPDPLGVPGDCYGCHYGTRLFEPERSFPAAARPGPDGERAVHVGEDLRNLAVVSRLQEHARRSDGLLGIPATLYVTALLDAAPEDSADAAIARALR